MEYHILYVKSRKCFEVRSKKNLLLCRVQKKAHGKFITLPCAKKTHCAKIKHMANIAFAVYFSFAVCFCKHTRENAYLPCARDRAHGKL